MGAPTALGYSAQGLCKFGFYEVFKKLYADAMGEENAYLYMTGLYLAASASAEFFADIALSPMEACKVRIQTSPVGTFPTTLRGAFPKIMAAEGINGVYCAIVSHPADTLVSYLNKAPGAGIGAAVKTLGFGGLWQGLGPRIVMIGTLTALQWFIYDGVKVQLRLPRPPPPEMPASLKAKMAAAQS